MSCLLKLPRAHRKERATAKKPHGVLPFVASPGSHTTTKRRKTQQAPSTQLLLWFCAAAPGVYHTSDVSVDTAKCPEGRLTSLSVHHVIQVQCTLVVRERQAGCVDVLH